MPEIEPGEGKSKTRAAAASPSSIRRVRPALLRWYDANRRDLPWRHTRDPYAIWISETMLQQTRVETVIPYWERFLARFPDVASLAARRARRRLARLGGPRLLLARAQPERAADRSSPITAAGCPTRPRAARRLSGIGRYTAGAVASIAFEREEPLVDGNVVRVFARLEDIREDTGEKAVVERLWSLASELVRGPRPGDLNQALMELGATLCTPKRPHCLACPVQRDCRAAAAGDPETLPRKKKRTAGPRAARRRRRDRTQRAAARRPATGEGPDGGPLGAPGR